jgi:hypothetical protein
MTAMEFPDAWVYPTGEDGAAIHYYAPKVPGIAVDANGRRQFNLIGAGSVSFLQITGAWGLSQAQVARLKEDLGRRLGRPADELDVRPVPETVNGVSLVLHGENGDTVLQEAKSSGMAPHHAAFNVMLDAEQVKTVRAALDGEEGRLSLRYDLTRRLPVSATSHDWTHTAHTEEGSSDDCAWSASAEESRSSTTQEATEDIETLSVALDAADWGAAR